MTFHAISCHVIWKWGIGYCKFGEKDGKSGSLKERRKQERREQDKIQTLLIIFKNSMLYGKNY
jgi:hypothetical protein